MSAPSESAASPSPCACTNISLMQLFHELKQKFPAVPDHVVSHTIELYCHDKNACETHLHREAKASLTHAYHASSSAAARQHEIRPNAPVKCPNQPIVKHGTLSPTLVTAVPCQEPQRATISSPTPCSTEEQEKCELNTDANQNVVEAKNNNVKCNDAISPVTINIDNCIAKYSRESPCDLELTNEEATEEVDSAKPEENLSEDSKNYRILKSNKIKNNLNERLEKVKEKKTIKEDLRKQDTPPQPLQNAEKPKRPNTLEFLPNPDIAFKPASQNEGDTNKSVSSTSAVKQEPKELQGYWPERGYPVNLSVNVNCHMDYSRGFDPWSQDYESPRAITSVNLTVCTPTSNMASPIRDARDEDGGFEGCVTVTVSPSTARPPWRRAPPPPASVVTMPVESPRSNVSRGPVEPSLTDRSLIDRQKERLGRLAAAIAQEKGRLAQITREVKILENPAPSAEATRKLKDYVHRLRDHCASLSKKLEICGTEPDFYSNIYTGQRPRRPVRPAPPPPEEAPSWECHVCTFRNHGLLDKCEECEMPRILIGTSPSTTLDSGFGSFRNRRANPTDTMLFDEQQACV